MKRFLFALLLVAFAGSALVVSTAVAKDKAQAAAALGEKAPDFSLTDQNGKTVSLSDYSGKIVVLEWFNNECPFVKKHYTSGHMNALASKYAEKDVVWLAINSTDGKSGDANKAIADEWKIDRPILDDSNGATGQAYGAKTTPHMYVINKDGVLAYAGAIDSVKSADSGDIAEATNYVAKAVDELLAGETVTTPETTAYGCSVKYAH